MSPAFLETYEVVTTILLRRRAMRKMILLTLFVSLVPCFALAQTPQPPSREHRGHGYVFVGPGAFTNESVTFLHYGGGLEGLMKGGLGVGIELAGFNGTGEFSGGFGTLSPDISYHFLNASKSRKLVPFVTGGYTLFIGGGGVANAIKFGVCVNYWFKDRIGLRIEVRDHVIAPAPEYNLIGVRFGLAFR